MLCVLETPIDLAMWVKLDNLIRNKRGTRNRVVVVEPIKIADFSQMKKGEKLTLVAHGGTTTFGGMTPDKLADTLIEKKLRPDIASIRLSGCHSGSYDDGTPVCLQLSRALLEKTKHLKPPLVINVTGFVGTAVTFFDGHVRVKIKRMDPKEGPTYSEILNKYKKTDQFQTWVQMASKLPCSTQKEIIQSAQIIAKESSSLFEELYLLNKQVTMSGAISRLRVSPYD